MLRRSCSSAAALDAALPSETMAESKLTRLEGAADETPSRRADRSVAAASLTELSQATEARGDGGAAACGSAADSEVSITAGATS
eukprot:5485567-Prymnesium_polylepis.1